MKLTPLYPQLTDPLEQRANMRLALEDFANLLLIACQWAETWQRPVFEYGQILFYAINTIKAGENWSDTLNATPPLEMRTVTECMDELRTEIVGQARGEIIKNFLLTNEPKPMTQLELEKKLNGWQS